MNKDYHPAYFPYLCFVVLCGLTVLILSISEMVRGSITYHWMILASLTAITSALAIKIPELDLRISVADTFLFINLVLFGLQAGTITAALLGLAGSIRAKSADRRLHFALFNMGALALSAYVSGQLFFRMLGTARLFGGPDMSLGQIMLPMCVLALTFYLCNSGSVATIIALELRKSIYRVWTENFRWTHVTYFTAAAVAALIVINVRSISPIMVGATIPIILITYITFHSHKQRIEEGIRRIQELSKLYLRTVETLALAVDAKDQTTYGHVRRVHAYAMGLARLRGISDANELLAIETGSLLHDIGKLAVDDYILNKPDQLSHQELEKMKAHTIAGEEILNHVEFPYPVSKIVRAHHERWDGKGYPDGLKGEQIPIGARMLAIVDSFDAMRSPRQYKVARTIQECVQELRGAAGSMYDPDLVELFTKNIDHLVAEATEAVGNMRELSFRAYSGKSDSGSGTTESSAIPPIPDIESEANAELVSLDEFCTTLGKGLCLSDLLVHLDCRLRRLLRFSSCAFFLDDGDGSLRVAHAGGKFSDKLQNLRIGLGSGISGWVAAYGHPVMNSKAALEFKDLRGDFGSLVHALVVPLSQNEICLGTISLYSVADTPFIDDHLRILQMAAKRVAPLVAEARRRDRSATICHQNRKR
jgi:putative nucleotidyltransferase with HDIG domain